jgi:hypothetical protein
MITDIIIVAVIVVAGALVAVTARGLGPELVRYLRIRRM